MSAPFKARFKKREMKETLLAVLALSVLFTSCQPDIEYNYHGTDTMSALDSALTDALYEASGGMGNAYYQFPTDWSQLPQDPSNPITQAKVDLGRLLYHETGLGIEPKRPEAAFTYSCSSCHHEQGGFQACLPQGISDGGNAFGIRGEGRRPDPDYATDQLDVQPIRSPSILNIAYQTNVLWNGQFGATHVNVGTEASWTAGTPKFTNFLGYEGTETQAIAGMKVHRLKMDEATFAVYADRLRQAFPGLNDDTLRSRVVNGLAIAAYERTVLADKAPFQKWLRGDLTAMSELEKEGAVLFFGKAECSGCHNGPALNSMAFYALGMNDLDGPGVHLATGVDYATMRGRGGFTNRPEDDFKFKVPQLYNLNDSKFYGHGASFHSVYDVVKYKNAGVPENVGVPASQIDPRFHPLGLSEHEIQAIVAFIERGLHDGDLKRYVPTDLPSGNCFPVADATASMELHCN